MKLNIIATALALAFAGPVGAVGFVHTYSGGDLACASDWGFNCDLGPTVPGYSGFTVETYGKTFRQARKGGVRSGGSIKMIYYQDELLIERIGESGSPRTRWFDCTVTDCTALAPKWLGGDVLSLFKKAARSGLIPPLPWPTFSPPFSQGTDTRFRSLLKVRYRAKRRSCPRLQRMPGLRPNCRCGP